MELGIFTAQVGVFVNELNGVVKRVGMRLTEPLKLIIVWIGWRFGWFLTRHG